MISNHSFDTLIFSLVLDYLPTCHQRLSACRIAHELLSCLGLLLIIEPDSSLRSHRERSWREALQSIGFGLISYVKVTNLHCMAFRKLISLPLLTEDESERISQLFNIPQDVLTDEESNEETDQQSLEIDRHLFTELPYFDD